MFRKMSTFKLDSPKRNGAPFSLNWNPRRKPSSRGNFPFMYTLYRSIIVQIRIVALYIYSCFLQRSMEKSSILAWSVVCNELGIFRQMNSLSLTRPSKKKNKNKKKTRPNIFFIVTGKIARSYSEYQMGFIIPTGIGRVLPNGKNISLYIGFQYPKTYTQRVANNRIQPLKTLSRCLKIRKKSYQKFTDVFFLNERSVIISLYPSDL